MRIRNTYLLLVTIIGLFTLALYSTFAMFTASIDTDEFVSISASNLPTDTSILEYERLTIEAGDSKIIDLNISNNTSNNLYYGVWYELIEPSTKNDNIIIAKYTSSSNETFGSIASGVSNKVTIVVNNKTSDSITINIGVAYSITNSLNLALNRELVTGEYGNFNVSISASNATIEGGTNLTNLIKNGSFEDEGNDWSLSGASVTNTQKIHGNNSLMLNANVMAMSTQNLSVSAPTLNHVYYGRLKFLSSNNFTTADNRFEWYYTDASDALMVFANKNISTTNWSLLSSTNRVTSSTYLSNNWYIRNFIVNGNANSYVDELMLIDLTESFGSGKEPTKEWLDNNISYFDGSFSSKSDVVQAGNSITYTIKPTSGYRLDKATCDNGAIASVNGNKVTINNVSSDTKCSVNTVSNLRTSDEMLKYLGLTAKEGTPDFSRVATTDEGIYSATDDYGKSYYFRGASTKNYVKFANKWWRIIRINGDGTIRMIYDGTVAHNNGESSTDRHIGNSQFNVGYNDNAFVGYMYGTSSSSTYEETHANINNSAIKIMVDNWYQTNIENVGYSEQIADVIYCNDRKINRESGYYGDGAGGSSVSYGRYRLYSNRKPIFTCSQKNDAFTVKDTVKGNGALVYPVGLITADEVSMAGSFYGGDNNAYYLYIGDYYWTMSPSHIVTTAGISARAFYVHSLGDFRYGNVHADFGVRPVISLKNSIQLSGDGTINNPFVVE